MFGFVTDAGHEEATDFEAFGNLARLPLRTVGQGAVGADREGLRRRTLLQRVLRYGALLHFGKRFARFPIEQEQVAVRTHGGDPLAGSTAALRLEQHG